jgi:hypothetical protein
MSAPRARELTESTQSRSWHRLSKPPESGRSTFDMTCGCKRAMPAGRLQRLRLKEGLVLDSRRSKSILWNHVRSPKVGSILLCL